MTITDFGWDEFSAMQVWPIPDKIDFHICFRSSLSRSINEILGGESMNRDISSFDAPLEETIRNSLLLQFAFLQSVHGSTAVKVFLPGTISKSDLFVQTAQIFFCYEHVRFILRNGVLYGILASGVKEKARDTFGSLLESGRLNPFLSFCAKNAGNRLETLFKPGDLSLYEVKEIKHRPDKASGDLVKFADFLKEQKKLSYQIFGNTFGFPICGYFWNELLENEALQFVLSRFERTFYIEEEATKQSSGFYLL